MNQIEKLEDDQTFLRVEKHLYDHEAILSAAHKFTDLCYIHITSINADYFGIFFSLKNSNADLNTCIKEFCNELIDQQIRHNLEKSNKSIKELIIKKAFFPFQESE